MIVGLFRPRQGAHRCLRERRLASGAGARGMRRYRGHECDGVSIERIRFFRVRGRQERLGGSAAEAGGDCKGIMEDEGGWDCIGAIVSLWRILIICLTLPSQIVRMMSHCTRESMMCWPWKYLYVLGL